MGTLVALGVEFLGGSTPGRVIVQGQTMPHMGASNASKVFEICTGVKETEHTMNDSFGENPINNFLLIILIKINLKIQPHYF